MRITPTQMFIRFIVQKRESFIQALRGAPPPDGAASPSSTSSSGSGSGCGCGCGCGFWAARASRVAQKE